jgi:oligopeptide transport system substrate-binding protein
MQFWFGKGLATAALALAVGLGAVTAASAQVTYVRGNDGDPETLDQHKTSTVAEGNLLRDLYEGLVIENAAGETVPGVATEWTMSDDGLTYTFTLRDDAQWSNGDPVVAEDFVYSLRRIMDPATGAKYANVLYPIKNAETINKGGMDKAELGVRAVDDKTLEITLESPTAYFLELLTHQTGLPVHPASVEEHGPDFVQPQNMVTNGAYTLVSFTPNDRIVMEKSDTFHGADEVTIDRIEWIPFEERATCVRRFEAGEVHTCSDFPAEQANSLKERLGDQVRIAPYLGTYYYALNSAKPPLDNVAVRQAISMAIDREFLANDIYSGTMIPAYSLVPPGIANYVENPPQFDWAEESMLDREDRAAQMLAEAGITPESPITLELSYNTGEDHKNTATAVAEMLRPLGINVTFNVRDVSAHYAMLRDEKSHQIARAGWIGDYSDPQNFLFLNESANTGFNYGNYNSPEYDALMQKAAAATDIDERAAILAEAETVFLRDVPQVPLMFYSSRSLVSPKVSGWEDNLRNVHPTRFLSIQQ